MLKFYIKIFILLVPIFLYSFDQRLINDKSTDFKIPTNYWTDPELAEVFENDQKKSSFVLRKTISILFKGKNYTFEQLSKGVFKCEGCGQKTGSVSKHLLRHEVDRGEFVCKKCKVPTYYKKERDLKIHSAKTH